MLEEQTATERPAEARDRAWWATLLVLALATVALRSSALSGPFNGDEAVTAWTLGQSLPDAWRWIVEVDTHPPLHYLLLRPWSWVFGSGNVALRSLSLVLGAGTVVISGAAAKVLAGRWAGLAAAAFVAVSPALQREEPVARQYALVAFGAAVVTWGLARMCVDEDPRRGAWAAVGGAVLVAWSQTGSGIMVGLAVVVAGGLLPAERWSTGRAALVGPAVALGLLAPAWVLLHPGQAGNVSDLEWIQVPGVRDVLSMVSWVLPGPDGRWVSEHVVLRSLIPAALIATLATWAAGRRRAIVAIVALVVPLVFFVVVSHLWAPILIKRVVMWAVPPLAVLVAVAMRPLRGRGVSSRVATGAVVVLMLGGLASSATQSRNSYGHHESLVWALGASEDGDVLITVPNSWEFLYQRLADQGRFAATARGFPVSPIADWDAPLAGEIDHRIEQAIGGPAAVWLVRPRFDDPGELGRLLRELNASGRSVTGRWQDERAELLRFERCGAPGEPPCERT